MNATTPRNKHPRSEIARLSHTSCNERPVAYANRKHETNFMIQWGRHRGHREIGTRPQLSAERHHICRQGRAARSAARTAHQKGDIAMKATVRKPWHSGPGQTRPPRNARPRTRPALPSYGTWKRWAP